MPHADLDEWPPPVPQTTEEFNALWDRVLRGEIPDRYGLLELLAGVTVARPGCRVLARPGGRDSVPRVLGRCRLPVFAAGSLGPAWLVALTA